jgi:hypothetical protein
MALKLESAQLLLYRAATHADNGLPSAYERCSTGVSTSAKGNRLRRNDGSSVAAVPVAEALDVVFAEIAADVKFDQLERYRAGPDKGEVCKYPSATGRRIQNSGL